MQLVSVFAYWLQGFDSPQQPQLAAPKSPVWVKPDSQFSPANSVQYVNADNKENALPEPTSVSRKSPGSHMPGIVAHRMYVAVTGGRSHWNCATTLVCDFIACLPRYI